MRPMKGLGDKPFHTILLMTEVPARWRAWQLAPAAAGLAAVAGLAWAAVSGEPALGWAAGLGLLLLAAADWAFLAGLPRRGLSFGAVQPPWLGLLLLRWVLALAGAIPASRWPLPAFWGLAAVQVVLWAPMAYGTLVEPFRLRVTRLAVRSAKLANPGRPLRIVQISDLHVERLTRRERALQELVAGLSPDLIVITGDFLSTSYNEDPRALADLRELLGQIEAPGGVYAVWGTAEVDIPAFLRPALAELGIRVLEDEALEVAVAGRRLWLMGMAPSVDAAEGEATLRTLLDGAPPGAFTLLLHHVPDLMPQAAALDVDLFLAGHTHGGQWRLPGFGAILTSSRFWKRYEGGAYREGGTQLYVSRGIGMEGFGAPRARFFCPPEVVAISLGGTGNG
jgi:predicted MPP superfamily phosphohydrolase